MKKLWKPLKNNWKTLKSNKEPQTTMGEKTPKNTCLWNTSENLNKISLSTDTEMFSLYVIKFKQCTINSTIKITKLILFFFSCSAFFVAASRNAVAASWRPWPLASRAMDERSNAENKTKQRSKIENKTKQGYRLKTKWRSTVENKAKIVQNNERQNDWNKYPRFFCFHSRERWYVWQFLFRQFIWFCSTIQEWVVLVWVHKKVEIIINRTYGPDRVWLFIISTFLVRLG